jgi:hypothetical protein
LSHAARSGVLRQLAANSAGMGNAMPPLSDGKVRALRFRCAPSNECDFVFWSFADVALGFSQALNRESLPFGEPNGSNDSGAESPWRSTRI